MQLGQYQVSTLRPPPILSIDFSVDGRIFGVATESGYEMWRTAPLCLLRRRTLPGTLAKALPLADAPLVALQGGGHSPLYAPNKVVLYNDQTGQAVAELEFRRVLAYEIGSSQATRDEPGSTSAKGKGKAKATGGREGFWVTKLGEWETALNQDGLMAVSTASLSTLLAIPGRQPGHVQLIHLPPCPPLSPSTPTSTNAYRSPIILAHTHQLSSLGCTASGSHIVTTSERGTLLRVWDTGRGRLERELRRGVDRAEMWGAVLEDGILSQDKAASSHGLPGGRVAGWSDKGTVHMWGVSGQASQEESHHNPSPSAPSLTNLLSRNIPLPKYFSSTPSTALYHLPRKNPHAFASAIGAAAEKARMPSMKMSQAAADEEGEWSERFVVTWVEVEVEVTATPHTTTATSLKAVSASSNKTREDLMGGIDMGTREERRSFGSDRTATATMTGAGAAAGGMMGSSRTPTPTMGRNTPSIGAAQYGARPARNAGLHERSFSSSSRDTAKPVRRVAMTSTAASGHRVGEKETRRERQLVAITYGGDWYRLRPPATNGGDPGANETVGESVEGRQGLDLESRKARRLELLEYRRLNVGGGGW